MIAMSFREVFSPVGVAAVSVSVMMKKSFFDTMTNNTNNNSFTSLENITLLINRLVNSENNNALPLKYISKLVNDFSNLLKESDYYDVEIKVGTDVQDGVKAFKAHSGILKTRCSYFKIALSNNWIKRSDDGIILFEKENISPKIFEVLLM